MIRSKKITIIDLILAGAFVAVVVFARIVGLRL